MYKLDLQGGVDPSGIYKKELQEAIDASGVYKKELETLAGGGPAPFAYPQLANIIINTPLDGSLTSTVGPNPTFARTGIRNYANSETTLAEVATGVPAFGATVFGSPDTHITGLELTGETENLLLWSEDFTQAQWTAIGGATVSSNAYTDVFGTSLADSIIGGSLGDGVEQITGYLTANAGWPDPLKAYLFSVFLSCPSGTHEAFLQLRDTNDSSIARLEPCTLTTTPRRFEIYGNFPSTTTGYLACGIIANGGTVVAFGAQMQQAGNSGGSNMRARACAGPYVKTTNTTKFSNTEVLTFPAATVDNARASGSVSFWVKPSRDYTVINEGNIVSYFSLGSEQFACYDSSNDAIFYMGNPVGGNFGTGFGLGYKTGFFNHVCLSWDDTSNSRRVVVNGQTYYDGTAAFTTWTAGLDLYLGQHSGTPQYWSSFAVFRNFVMWDTQLSVAEMKSIHTGELPDFDYTYGTGLLFEADLGVSIAPTVAQNPVVQYDGTLTQPSFSHTGNIIAQQPYFSDANTYAGFQSYGNPPLPAAPPLNTATNKGMVVQPNNKNFILYSCEPGNAAWTPVGTPTIIDNVGNAFGPEMPYGTIDGVSGEGIKQSISLAIADNAFVASAWVKTPSGTLDGIIKIRGNSGGSPQETPATFTANSTDWTPIEIYNPFTGAGTGSCEMEIVLDQTGILEISGIQLERRLGGQFCNLASPTVFIKTEASTVEILPNFLWYKAAGNFNPLQGTFITWAWLDCDSSDIINSDGCTVFGIDGGQGLFIGQLHFVSDNLNFSYGAPSSTEIVTVPTPGLLKNRWTQISASWSATYNGEFTNKIYIDGYPVGSKTFTNGLLTSWNRVLIGSCKSSLLAADSWKGGFGKLRNYGTADDALVLADWNSRKAGYGR